MKAQIMWAVVDEEDDEIFEVAYDEETAIEIRDILDEHTFYVVKVEVREVK